MANAASGRIFVTCPGDHFGPITAEYDPRGQVRAVAPRTAQGSMGCGRVGLCGDVWVCERKVTHTLV